MTAPWRLGEEPWIGTRRAPLARVIIDNDFAGDPDDLFQLAHHLLSPAVEIRGIITSHLRAGDDFAPQASVARGDQIVRQLLDVMRLDAHDLLLTGSEDPLPDERTPQPSAGVDRIVAEAMRVDTDTPLFVVLGGGLTELASALLSEPAIADRLTAVWIGGPEYAWPVDDLASTGTPAWLVAPPPPGALAPEYNLAIDVTAAQVVFDSSVPLWQVPREAYRQCLVGDAELEVRLARCGTLGAHLHAALDEVRALVSTDARPTGGTYVLGDQPLVSLTALQTFFEPSPASSRFVDLPRPRIADDGTYVENPTAASVRVFTHIDTRLMFDDMYARFEQLTAWQDGRADRS